MLKKMDFPKHLKLYKLIFLFLLDLISIYIVIYFYSRNKKKKDVKCFLVDCWIQIKYAEKF